MFKAGMFITRMITVISQIRNVLKLICQLFTKGVVSHRERLKNRSSLNNLSIWFKQFGMFNVKNLFIFKYWLYYELIQ